MLTRQYLEKYEPAKRFSTDRRQKRAWAVFSYFDENGHEYRRAFWADKNTPENDFWNIAPDIIDNKEVA